MSTTCLEYRAHQRLAEDAPYWTSPAGVTKRISSIAQGFTYITVNHAMRTIGERGKVRWLEWSLYPHNKENTGDDRVCPICRANRNGGKDGRFKPGWFMPIMPAHYGCRCQWRVYYDEDDEQPTAPITPPGIPPVEPPPPQTERETILEKILPVVTDAETAKFNAQVRAQLQELPLDHLKNVNAIKYGVCADPRWAGQYQRSNKEITLSTKHLRIYGDKPDIMAGVLTHEVGHGVYHRPADRADRLKWQVWNSLWFQDNEEKDQGIDKTRDLWLPTEYAYVNPSEGYAESYADTYATAGAAERDREIPDWLKDIVRSMAGDEIHDPQALRDALGDIYADNPELLRIYLEWMKL